MPPTPRRFDTPAALFRALIDADAVIAATERHLDDLKAERLTLYQEGCDFLRAFPAGVTYRDHHFTRAFNADGNPFVRYTAAPFDLLNLDGWDLHEAEIAGPEAIGPGPGAPSYTVPSQEDEEAEAVYDHADSYGTGGGVPSNADLYLPAVGLSLVGVEVRDDDGDDL
jgi:hypothetical protein